jgi:hypothetical protein
MVPIFLSSMMLCYHYNTSTFSNKEGAIDHVFQLKVLVARLHGDNKNFDIPILSNIYILRLHPMWGCYKKQGWGS